MSRVELATNSQLSERGLMLIEHGKVCPTTYTVYKLAAALGMAISDLLPDTLQIQRELQKTVLTKED